MDSGSLPLIVEWFTTPILVASFLSCAAAGVVLCLIARYWQRFGSKDRLVFRLLVGYFTIAVIADAANECWWTYIYAVQGQLDPMVLVALPKPFIVYSCLTGLTILLVQAFFTWRIWIISGRKNYILPGIILLCQLAAFGIALYMVYAATQRPLFREFGEVRAAPWAWLALGLLCDILITGSTYYYLAFKPRQNGATRDAVVHSPMTRVVNLTARTNSLSLLMQVITLWLMIWKITTFHYSITGFLIVKVYIASVVVTLNARRSMENASDVFSDVPQSRLSRSQKPFGGLSVASRTGQHQSVQVHIEEETRIDSESRLDGLHAGGAPAGTRPFAVKFETARSDDSGWTGGEKSGDVEKGRMEDVRLDGSEKY
ncbi:hypothetical protein JCM10450v2_003144 [Rhodotorula kratochvilovae]